MSILLACALTVIIETGFFALCGYRKGEQLAIIVLVNIVTNLTLNLLLRYVLPYNMPVVLALELGVLAVEYAVYALAFGRSGRLFILTLLANLISFGLGGLLLRLILGVLY